MSTPVLWIGFPAIVALAAFLLRRWRRWVAITVAFLAVLLAILAWYIPIGQLITLGPWAFTFSDRFLFAGRQFVLGVTDRTLLMIVYLTLAFFFIGSSSIMVSEYFVPLGLAMSCLLLASLSVAPFLYAALFIEAAVLFGVPLLSPPGRQVDRSVLRFLTFLSFGLPFLLFSGWMLSDIGSEITDPGEVLPALIFLGFGFAFLLAIFPLNSWVPMLTGRGHPYTAAYVLTLLPLIVFALLLRFIDQYPWLLEFDVIPVLGLLMVITGGLWAAFQRDMGRLLGYAVIIEIGRSLLTVDQVSGESMYSAMLFSRIMAIGVWSLSLALIRSRTGELRFRAVQGFGRIFPLVAFGVMVGNFSLAGFPLLAGFTIHLSLLGSLAQESIGVALGALLGSIGLLIGGLRTLAVLVMGPEELPHVEKVNAMAQALIVIGSVVLILMGIFPQWFAAFFLG